MDKEALVYRRTIADLSASIKHFQHDFHDLAKHIQVNFYFILTEIEPTS